MTKIFTISAGSFKILDNRYNSRTKKKENLAYRLTDLMKKFLNHNQSMENKYLDYF